MAQKSDRESLRLSIPHPLDKSCNIVGILERHKGGSSQGRKIALILHGTLGHKDYLFLKRLAHRLPIDSFRFDFRGNHETGGRWKQGALSDDIEDIDAVVSHLKSTYGYGIDMLVGHSRGSIVSFRWMCLAPEAKTVSCMVNASGRYRMRGIYDSPMVQSWMQDLEKQGYCDMKATVARKPVAFRVRSEDVEEFANWDTSLVWTHFPQKADVLTIHGLSDRTVPPYDAQIYGKALGSRSPGIHSLCLVEDADHNFSGKQSELADTIVHWLEARGRGDLKSGVWLPEVRGKL